MNRETVNIFFILLGIVISLISINFKLLLPLFIGIPVIIQGIIGFIKKRKDKS